TTRRHARRSPASCSYVMFLIDAAQPSDLGGIFVAATGETDHDNLFGAGLRGEAHGGGQSVRRFESRQNALFASEQIEGFERVLIAAIGVFDPSLRFPITVLGTDPRVIQPGR